MKPKSVVGVGLVAIAALSGCYASEKIGKDIQDVSHDVNQGGIYMHHGALSVYRPERHPQPALTNASMTAPVATAPAAPPPASPPPDSATPMATPEWQPPADGSDALPKKDKEPAAPPPAAAAPSSDAGVYSM